MKKYSLYKKALRTFNSNKSLSNKLNLASKKADYKSCENKAKRRYHRQEGDMLTNLKRNNPREFYKLFRKSKRRGTNTRLNAQDFCRYFSDLMSTDEQVRFDEHDHQEPDSIFEEFDTNFSEDEIKE